jgi:hypothetical protein
MQFKPRMGTDERRLAKKTAYFPRPGHTVRFPKKQPGKVPSYLCSSVLERADYLNQGRARSPLLAAACQPALSGSPPRRTILSVFSRVRLWFKEFLTESFRLKYPLRLGCFA